MNSARKVKETQARCIKRLAWGEHATEEEKGRGCEGDHLGSVLAREQRFKVKLLDRLADHASGSRNETPSKVRRRPTMAGGDLAEVGVIGSGHLGHPFGLIPAVFLEECFGVHDCNDSNMLSRCQ